MIFDRLIEVRSRAASPSRGPPEFGYAAVSAFVELRCLQLRQRRTDLLCHQRGGLGWIPLQTLRKQWWNVREEALICQLRRKVFPERHTGKVMPALAHITPEGVHDARGIDAAVRKRLRHVE